MAQYTKEEIAAVMENGSERDKAALQKALKGEGTFAQTYNQKIADQGVRAGATQVKPEPKKAPAKASAAPKSSKSIEYTGLCAAMNFYEQKLVKNKTVEIANKYTVEFGGNIGSSKIVLPGTVDKTKTPGQNTDTAKNKIDPKVNSMDTQGLTRQVLPGTQIIQFIEQVVRNSEYITKQQKANIDQVTGNTMPSSTLTSTAKSTTWFKISINTKIIGDKIDKKRNDYAYHLTYIVTPYSVPMAASQFFNESKYRGIHKLYNYWFTGENTQVLHFEQSFNALFGLTMDGRAADFNSKSSLASSYKGIVSPWTPKNVPTARAAVTDKGADNGANNPASQLADFLYNLTDMNNVTLRIMGDPAWIQQGEVVGINAANFNYQGFYPDGTINSDAQRPTFALNWNGPEDYDNGSSGPYSGTGLMNVNASATNNNPNVLSKTQSKVSIALMASDIVSHFVKGKFEQELKGVLIQNLNQSDIDTIERLTPLPAKNKEEPKQESNKPAVTPPRVPQSVAPIPYIGVNLSPAEMQANQDWYNKYGKAYNADGTARK